MKQQWLKHKRAILALSIFALFVITAVAGTTIAKYTATKFASGEISDLHAFHLSSDLAEVDGAEVDWYNGTYGNGVRVRLYNYEKTNVALISEVDITYSVTVSGSDAYTVTVLDSTGVPVTATDGKYVLDAVFDNNEPARNYQDIIITSNPTTPTSNFTVTVSSAAPYVKTLSTTFALDADIQMVDYTITDMGRYDIVVIHTNGYSGNLTVTWDGAKLSPDNTNPVMENWVTMSLRLSRRSHSKPTSLYSLRIRRAIMPWRKLRLRDWRE